MGQDKQGAYIFPNGYFLCLSLVPMPFFAFLQNSWWVLSCQYAMSF